LVTEALRHPQIGMTWYQNGPQLARSILRNFLAEHQALDMTIRHAVETAAKRLAPAGIEGRKSQSAPRQAAPQ
jgi:hypothetical protein